MTIKKSIILAKKELTEIFRESSTYIMLLLPLIIFSIFNIGLDYINTPSSAVINVCVTGDNNSAKNVFDDYLMFSNEIKIQNIDSENPQKLLKDGEIDCIIDFSESNVNFIYNSAKYTSLSSATKIGENFQNYYYEKKSVECEEIYLFNLKDEKENISNVYSIISKLFIPITLILTVMQSTSKFANEMFAGERERKTLELLFLSGPNRKPFFFGKVIACNLVSTLNVTTMLIAFVLSDIIFGHNLFNGNGTSVNIFILFILLFLFAFLMNFVFVGISLFSKNLKSVQLASELVIFVVIGITALLKLGYINLSSKILAFIPIINIAVIFNNVFDNQLYVFDIIISFISNMIFVFLLNFLCIRYLNSEKAIN